MSVYYGNLLSANLPQQENFLNSDQTKFADGNFYSSNSSTTAGGGVGGGGGGAIPPYDSDNPSQLHRFHAYDRMDIHNAAKQSYHNFSSPAISTPGSTYGQYPEEGCSTPISKLPESAAATGMVSSAAAAGAANPMMYGTNGLSSMVNSMASHHSAHPQSQNLPIYPWMRPLSGGKHHLHDHECMCYIACVSYHVFRMYPCSDA